MTFHTDLEYWGIDKLLLDVCCSIWHYPDMETRRKEYESSKKHLELEECKRIENDFGESLIGCCRTVIYNLLESPESSVAARVIRNNMDYTRYRMG